MLLLIRSVSIILLVALMIGLAISIALIMYRANQPKKKKRNLSLQDAGIRELLIEDRYDEAVDLYQKFSGVDIFTAQQAIDDMRAEQEHHQ